MFGVPLRNLSVVKRATTDQRGSKNILIIKIWIMNTQENRLTFLSKSKVMEDVRSKETISCTTARVTKRRKFPQDASLERLKWATQLLQ